MQKHYDLRNLLLSGKRIPRTDGIILARAGSEEEVRAIIREDPFFIYDYGEYEIIPFIASMTVPELAHTGKRFRYDPGLNEERKWNNQKRIKFPGNTIWLHKHGNSIIHWMLNMDTRR